jgi:hypothetical protein
MDEKDIKEFSKVISQKLRHIKLAITKSSNGQNKFNAETKQKHQHK